MAHPLDKTIAANNENNKTILTKLKVLFGAVLKIKSQIDALKKTVDSQQSGLPIGYITYWAGKQDQPLPSSLMVLDGRMLPKASYPELYKLIGTTYGGVGDLFEIPNLLDRHMRSTTSKQGGYGGIGETLEDAIQGSKGTLVVGESATELGKNTSTGIFFPRERSTNYRIARWAMNEQGTYSGIEYDFSRVLRTAEETRVKALRLVPVIVVK